MSAQGFGELSLGEFLISYVFAHVRDIMGEISAVKGLQGAKGFPW